MKTQVSIEAIHTQNVLCSITWKTLNLSIHFLFRKPKMSLKVCGNRPQSYETVFPAECFHSAFIKTLNESKTLRESK
jgi:hypothetical protein